jgi:2'-5' RNA ligase
MNDDARLFYALWPDDTTRAHLQRLQASVTGRKVRPENLHLTLAFLGNQPKSRLPVLAGLLDKLPDQSFAVDIDRYGYFSKPRIAWAGPSASPPPLLDLQQSLMQALSEAQIPVKPQGQFTPHVTLARDANSLNESFAPGVAWRVGKIVLVQSLQVKGGAIYSPLMEKRLS